jgi:hypothetical protein
VRDFLVCGFINCNSITLFDKEMSEQPQTSKRQRRPRTDYDNNDDNDNPLFAVNDQPKQNPLTVDPGASFVAFPSADDIAIDRDHNIHTTTPSSQSLSIEDMLGVPVEIMVRPLSYERQHRCGRKRTGKPLLTRAEANLFLRLRLLAQEMDIITALSEKVLYQQRTARQLRHKLIDRRMKNGDGNANPWLIPLLPILRELTKEEDSPLVIIRDSMTRLVESLQGCADILSQQAEQNWALVDSLLDIVTAEQESQSQSQQSQSQKPHHHHPTKPRSGTQILASEKQHLAELQEHVAQRIDTLLVMQFDPILTNQAEAMLEDDPTCKASSSNNQTRLAFHDKSASQRSEGEDDRRFLTDDELFTPLEVVCQRMFPNANENSNTADIHDVRDEASFIQQDKIIHNSSIDRVQGQNANRQDPSGNDKLSSPSPSKMATASQSAAATILSFSHTTKAVATANMVTNGHDHSNGQNLPMSLGDSSSTYSNHPRGFEYPYDDDADGINGDCYGSGARSRTAAQSEEERLENSQFPFPNKNSAAEALAHLVNGSGS